MNALSISAYTADDGYHLTGPKRWLESGALQYLPTMTHTNAPMGVEMLYTIPLGIWSDTSARLLALAIGIFALSSVIALGRIRQSVWLGLAAVTLLVFGFLKFNLFQLLTDAYVDFAVTLEVTCAAIAILYFLRSSDRRWAVVAALFAGFAASFKPTALFLGISIAIVLLMELVRMRSSNIPKLIVSLLIICLLPLLPWMFRTWYLTGNPIYPMLANVFPTRDWSAEQGVAFTNFFKYYNWGTFMGSGMSLHHRVVILNVLRGVIALSAIAALRKITNIENRVLYVLICLFGISLMSNTGLYIRYYLPIQGIAYVLALSLLMRNRFSVKIAQITIPILILVIVWVGMKSDRGNYMEKTKFITGINSREKQLSSDTSGFYQTWKYVNEKVEPDAPILVTAFFQSMAMNAGGTFLSDHPCYTTDAYLQTCIRMDTWENYIKDIQRLKLEYVFSSSILRYENHSASYAPAANEYPFSRRLVKEYGNLLFRAGEFEVYKLDGLNDSLYFKQR